VRGRLGEWIAVGGAQVSEDRRERGVLSAGAEQRSSQRGVWLKVEAVAEPASGMPR